MPDKNPLVELIHHDEGYHEVIFHDNSREAVTIYTEMLEALLVKHLEANDQARLLINLTEGKMPAIAAISQQARRLLHEHRADRQRLHLRGAFLATSDEAIILSLAQSFINMMPVDAKMETFTTEHRAEALAWLFEVQDG